MANADSWNNDKYLYELAFSHSIIAKTRVYFSIPRLVLTNIRVRILILETHFTEQIDIAGLGIYVHWHATNIMEPVQRKLGFSDLDTISFYVDCDS